MLEEKIFNIPLREAFERPRTKRAEIATDIVRIFLARHMKSENIKMGDSINKEIWKRGIQKPPRKIRIHATKEENIVYAELLGVEIKTPSKEELKKKEKKKKEKKEKIKEERKERRKRTIQEEIEEEVKGKPKEIPEEGKPKEEKKEEPKKEEKPKEELKKEENKE